MYNNNNTNNNPVWIPEPPREPEKILHRLKVQNEKLPMSSWRMVNTKVNLKEQQVVVTMDENMWKTLQDIFINRLHL